MGYKECILTVLGSFMFTLIVILCWGRMVNKMGAVGGFLAAMIIPGTMWMVNHGLERHMITQAGAVWIDMAVSVGIGVFISSVIQGGSIKKSKRTLSAALIAGIIGGTILKFI